MALFSSYDIVKKKKNIYIYIYTHTQGLVSYLQSTQKKIRHSSTNLRISNPGDRLREGKVLDTHPTQTKSSLLDF